MADKTKLFRVATSGATTDGRAIEPQDIVDMVATFNVEALTPRVNMEHIRGYSDQPPFCAYGDVVGLEARDVELKIAGKAEKRKALYAQIKPTAALTAMVAAGQKIFTSIEIRPNFGGSGKAGLVGLAVTDNPASFGTEALAFSATSGLLAARKDKPDDLFAEGVEAVIEMEADDTAGVMGAMKAMFDGFAAKFAKSDPAPEPKPEPKTPANDNDLAAFARTLGETMTAAIGVYAAKNDAAVARIGTDLAALTGKLEKTEVPGFSRQAAPGGVTALATDC